MSDRIFLQGMAFEGRHGVSDEERSEPQVIEVDAEVELDLHAAGTTDDLNRTVNYSEIFEICRAQVEEHSYHLLEAIGEAICRDALSQHPAIDVIRVTVRKPGVPIEGVIEYAGVMIERTRGSDGG